MYTPQLLKSNWIKEEDTRIIDNNAVIEARIKDYFEAQKKQKRAAEDGGSEYFDEYNSARLDALMSDQSRSNAHLKNLAGFDAHVGTGEDDAAEAEEDFSGDYYESEEDFRQGQVPESDPDPLFNESDRIIEEARRRADEIIAAANEEVFSLKEEAEKRGYEEGRLKGEEDGRQEALKNSADQYEEKKKQLEAEYQKMLDEIEPEMVDTLTRIYERVFDVNLSSEKKIILHLLKNTLSKIEDSSNLIVHISPNDYDEVEDEKDRLLSAIPHPNVNLEIIEDPLLKANECMVEADGGIFDCSLGTELSELSRKLKLLAFDRRRD